MSILIPVVPLTIWAAPKGSTPTRFNWDRVVSGQIICYYFSYCLLLNKVCLITCLWYFTPVPKLFLRYLNKVEKAHSYIAKF